jgi:DNA-binding MarR family transcriptional regulator
MTQKDDFDLREFLPYLLNQAAEISSQSFQRIYKGRYGMLRTEWRVLFHLAIFERMTAKDICEKAIMHKTKVSRAVQRLEQRRYLQRKPDEKDRRHEWLTLTSQGRAVYEDLRAHARQHDQVLMQKLSTEEITVLRRALNALSQP